ncbi:MAG TPA: type I DNA topoisomerase [Candidatus Pristimantibacillus sp.]|jgi:DNA topoisomerase-1|nr:type I DNA topoisomerase [Candidatus Pristimantibacillus sp.]
MSKNLVIVESPAKAKTIEKYLGKDFTVKSSFGHIRDLPKKGLNIDIDNGFAPTYEVNPDKKKVVSELRAAAKGAEVWLASDEDREGEAIAWHLAHVLKLDPAKTKRIVFHEITKTALESAIANPRTVDLKLVDAQQARRVLDRLVGYELSPVLWKKVRTGLSAGRVQSVAVRLIVEREREIKDHQAESSYKVVAIFTVDGQELKAELVDKIPQKDDARKFLTDCTPATFTVEAIDQKPGSRNPGAPFTTSTLQQEAARRLGYSVKQTMTLAQRLYEEGNITYMRTDSTVLSGFAIKAAEEFIKKNYGDKYWQVRQYKTKSESAQEAHEAIRPTDFARLEAGSDSQQQKLYQLIWQRALASQMAPAATERTEVNIGISTRSEKLLAKGEVLTFDGFLKVYGGGKDDTILPAVQNGQQLPLASMSATETFTRPAARYSEASLVKTLEELGIGRPSTYAPTISTVQTRGYVEKKDLEGTERTIQSLTLQNGQITEATTTEITGADRNKLVPTPVADITTDFLIKYFPSIVDYDFTATVEKEFDLVEEGQEEWQKVIQEFYKDFHPLIAKSEEATRAEVSQARELGADPKTGKPIVVRFGRYGPMLQRGETESEEKPTFAPLPAGADMDTVTLEQALKMFELPRSVGTTDDGKEIKANIGRFGPYIQVDKLFVSIKPKSPFDITEAEARELYKAKLEKEANKYIQVFKSGVQVVNGPYGPYITDGKKNAKIPEGKDPKTITEDECKKLLAEAPARGKRRFYRKTKK